MRPALLERLQAYLEAQAERAGLPPPGRLQAALLLLPLLSPLPYLFLPKAYAPIALLPLVIGLLPLLRLRAAVAKRAWGAEADLPFMALLVSLFGLRGALSLPKALELTAGLRTPLLPAMREEGLLYSLLSRLRGLRPLAALEQYAKAHPSSSWRAYIEGYAGVADKGASPQEYARTYVDVFLSRLEEEWRRSSMSLSSFIELSALLMALAPSFAVLLGFFYGLGIAYSSALLSMLIIAASSPALIALVSLMQPHRGDIFPLRPLLALPGLALILLPIAQWAWPGPLHRSLLLSLFASLLALSPFSFLRARRLRALEEELLRLLEQMEELLRIGETPLSALSKHQLKGARLTPYLLKLRMALEQGRGLNGAAELGTPSRLVNLVLFSLVLASEQGGGLDEVDRIRRFVLAYLEARRSLERASLVSLGVAMFAPAISLYAIHLLGAILGGALATGSTAPGDFYALVDLAKLLPVEASLCMGFLLSRASSQTLRDLRYPLLSLLPLLVISSLT
jgi:Flp pilus assembly protein TadB